MSHFDFFFLILIKLKTLKIKHKIQMSHKVLSVFILVLIFKITSLNCQNIPELRIQLGHKDDINKILFDPNGKFVVSCSDDKTIKVWDVKSGKELFTLAGHEQKVKTIAINQEGTRLLSEIGRASCRERV